jgi:transposase-like protein
LDALLPILYSRGVSMSGEPLGSTGDFQEALGALLGRDAPNLSPSVLARLRGEWEADYARWQGRDLSARRYVNIWVDGVYLQARMEPQAECPTTKASRGHAGADRRHTGGQEGTARLPGGRSWSRFRQRSCWNTSGGIRESTQSWRELLVGLKARGLTIAPELATGDGALGFWKALDTVSPTTRHQRIVAKLRQVEVLVGQGKPVAEGVRAIGVTEATYYRWRAEYGGLKLDQVKRLKVLEQENGRLRRAVADLTLEKLVLKEAASGNTSGWSGSGAARGCVCQPGNPSAGGCG